MAEIPRLNGIIKALEQGSPLTTFTSGDVGRRDCAFDSNYDGVVFEMEHNSLQSPTVSRDCMQYMLNRRQIVR